MNRVVNLLWEVVTGFTAVVVVPVPPAVGIAVVTALVVVSEMRFTLIPQKSQTFHVKTEEAHAFSIRRGPDSRENNGHSNYQANPFTNT